MIGTQSLCPLAAVVTTAVIVFSSIGCSDSEPAADAEGASSTTSVDFVTDVKPILQEECVRCHHDGAIMGGLNLMNRELAMKGSTKGPVIIPGDPEKSPFYRVTQLPEDQDHAMPATGAKLTEEEKQTLFQWIKEGADWPEGDEGTLRPIAIEPKKV